MEGSVTEFVESLRDRPVLVVVTGAGATYDSIGSIPPTSHDVRRPPLTQQLFAEGYLQRYLAPYPAARSLIAALSIDPSKADFETLLSRELEASRSPDLARRFVALRFYLRDLIEESSADWSDIVVGATNYSWLVAEVEHWRDRVGGYVAWVTFNYDQLLENALADLYTHDFGHGGVPDIQLSTYTSPSTWSLTHLHGSVRWTRFTPIERGPAGRQNAAAVVVAAWDAASDPPSPTTMYQRHERHSSDDVLLKRETPPGSANTLGVPALTAPLAAKAAFECPPSHAERLKLVLSQADLLVAVGWRAQEPHFSDVLKKAFGIPPGIVAVSRNAASAEESIENLRTNAFPQCARSDLEATALDVAGFSGLRRDCGNDFRTMLGQWVQEARIRRQAMWSPSESVPS